jgi:branched-chain amino acid transport system ATP-binding protein
MGEAVMEVIGELKAHGVTILLVEQNVHNALSVASRAYVLETGQVVAQSAAAELLNNKDVLRAYLGG